MTLKIVYYGPPLSGKTSNLRNLHSRVDANGRGRLMTIDTRDDRTLFFDLLPLFFRGSNFSLRVKVYTVPGQPAHEATRRMVLAGADAVVFVADSQASQQDANRTSWENLLRNLATVAPVPVLLQYNKRDCASALPLEALPTFRLPPGYQSGLAAPVHAPIAAEAVRGVGVIETFLAIADGVWHSLDREFGLTARYGIAQLEFARALRAQFGLSESVR